MTAIENVASRVRIAPDYWEEGPANSAILIAAKCDQCGTCYLPKVMVCVKCGGRKFGSHRLKGTGHLYIHTVIHVVPAGYPAPYSVGYADFDDDVRVFGHVRLDGDVPPAADCEVRIETAELFKKPDGQSVVGYRFVPIARREAA